MIIASVNKTGLYTKPYYMKEGEELVFDENGNKVVNCEYYLRDVVSGTRELFTCTGVISKYLMEDQSFCEEMRFPPVIPIEVYDGLTSYSEGNFIVYRQEKEICGMDKYRVGQRIKLSAICEHIKIVNGQANTIQRFKPFNIKTENNKFKMVPFISLSDNILQVYTNDSDGNGYCLYDVTKGEKITPPSKDFLDFCFNAEAGKRVAYGCDDVGSESLHMCVDECGNFFGTIYSSFHNSYIDPNAEGFNYVQLRNEIETAVDNKRQIDKTFIDSVRGRVRTRKPN